MTEAEDRIKKEILQKLEQVIDPEIGIDIVNLGLVYGIEVSKDLKKATIKLTMTSPSCPVIPQILGEIKRKLSEVESVEEIKVDLVWDPPWNPNMMSKKAKMLLGLE